MPGFDLSFSDNADAVARRIGGAADKLEQATTDWLVSAGDQLEGEISARAPRGPKAKLARSIKAGEVEVDPRGDRYIEVAAHQHYGHIQERGARHHISGKPFGGHGFFKGGVAATEKGLARDLERVISEALDEI